MYSYAFVGYLDYETEAQLKSLWKDLSDANITQYGIETEGKRPHITIADYDNLEKKRFIELLDNFYEEKRKIDMYLSILGTFINTGTLFVAPSLSSELLEFHRNHHSYFRKFNKNDKSFYLPGKWSPHCTIASRLSEENMIQVLRYCKNSISKTYCKLNEIALIEIKFNEDGVAIEDKIIFSKELK